MSFVWYLWPVKVKGSAHLPLLDPPSSFKMVLLHYEVLLHHINIILVLLELRCWKTTCFLPLNRHRAIEVIHTVYFTVGVLTYINGWRLCKWYWVHAPSGGSSFYCPSFYWMFFDLNAGTIQEHLRWIFTDSTILTGPQHSLLPK